jgi:hypothetical protein
MPTVCNLNLFRFCILFIGFGKLKRIIDKNQGTGEILINNN